MREVRCFACDRVLKREYEGFLTDRTSDGKAYVVPIGAECLGRVKKAGRDGYQPPKGGPRVFYNAPAKETAE